MPTIALKRAYEKPARGDGIRILVDRLWPRGIKKEDLASRRVGKGAGPQYRVAEVVRPRRGKVAGVSQALPRGARRHRCDRDYP